MAFDGIKSVAWEDKVRQARGRRIRKMVLVLMNRQYQFYFHRWKGVLLEVVNKRARAVDETLYHAI